MLQAFFPVSRVESAALLFMESPSQFVAVLADPGSDSPYGIYLTIVVSPRDSATWHEYQTMRG
jgi:hypothetical protein